MTSSSDRRYPGPGAPSPSTPASPPSADQLFAMALGHHQRGQLAQAERLYRDALAVNPRHAGALHFAGVAALNQGRLQDAAKLIEQSIALRDADPQAHYHLGLVMGGLQRFEEAAAHNRRAIALRPDFLDAHMNLGNALKALGRLDEAAAAYRHVITANPKLAVAHYNLANVLFDRRELDAATAAYQRALAADPNNSAARQNFAMALLMLGRHDEAIAQFRLASAARRNFTEAELGLSLALMQKGNAAEALVILCRVLDSSQSSDAKSLFVECVRSLNRVLPIPGLEKHLLAALTEPWAEPHAPAGYADAVMRSTGATAAIYGRAAAAGADFELTQSELQALAGSRLLLAVLENAAVASADLERILTAARRALLALAGETDAADEALLGFASALAQHCFISEYVFDLAEDERAKAQALRDRLEAESPSPLMLAVVASYFPLYGVAGADRALARAWPAAIDALLTLQLREPRLERELRDVMPQLTPIDSDVSVQVRQQYEENPYPRWVKLATGTKPLPLDDYIRKALPVAPLQPTGKAGCDILVAGCGTGEHTLALARGIAGAKILAVDLSKASLAHAQRRTRELGVDNIEYGQADILKLAMLGRSFDLIACTGVLHHMADPFAAWRDLTALLRPGGLMILGLYSEIARQSVVAARAFIAAEGYKADAEGIRRVRQAIRALPDGAPVKSVTAWADFRSISECRDLLFHVQEHRMTIPQLKRAVDELGVRFLGFTVRPDVTGRYRARFPRDTTMTDLENWHAHETDNPRTFMGMYRFVVQKPDGDCA